MTQGLGAYFAGHVLRQIGDTGYLIPIHEDPMKLLVLDRVGIFFYKSLLKSWSVAKTAVIASDYYRVPLLQIKKDLNKFIESLFLPFDKAERGGGKKE